jgi:hypothetical protein
MKTHEALISDIASEALRKWGLIKHTGATDEHLLELFRMVAREAAEKVYGERDELLAAVDLALTYLSDAAPASAMRVLTKVDTSKIKGGSRWLT